MNFNLELCRLINQKISESFQEKITFSEYMDLVLYHPQHGYYSRGLGLGSAGDFVTSPYLGSDFGELLAEQLVEMWQIMGFPQPFQLVEMGAGQGILAGDILRYIKKNYIECFESIEYIIIETSKSFNQEQKKRLYGQKISWCDWDEISLNSITGCFFSNELVDAFPVHQIAIQDGHIREVYVASPEEYLESKEAHLDGKNNPYPMLADGSNETHKNVASSLEFSLFKTENLPQSKDLFLEIIGEPSTPKLVQYFDFIGIDLSSYPDGYRSEVNLAALAWIETVAKHLRRGYLLTIDYGYSAHRYYSLGRSQGTLQCYYQHRYHNNPYIHLGYQDLTAHVNFTALERQGEACGLSTVGFTQQALFLMALGLGDRLSAIGSGDGSDGQRTATVRDIASIMQRRQALQSLIDPMGLGGFGVLVQQKGLSESQKGRSLKGFVTVR